VNVNVNRRVVVMPAVEIGLAHAHLLKEAERGRELTTRNEALNKAKEEAEEGFRAKSEFLAVVSHEIRFDLPLLPPLLM
jgi:signal transduction histidine kinase